MNSIEGREPTRMSFMESLLASCGTASDRKNQYRFVGWCFTWALSVAGVSEILISNPNFRGTGAYLLALIPFALSVVALRSYLRFLREADEFLRRVQLEALATGFGAGILLTMGYRLMIRAGAPELTSKEVVLIFLGCWVVGQIVATWRYR